MLIFGVKLADPKPKNHFFHHLAKNRWRVTEIEILNLDSSCLNNQQYDTQYIVIELYKLENRDWQVAPEHR